MMKLFEAQSIGIFKTIFDSVSEGIVVVNAKRQIVATNPSANQMFGYSNGELTGQSLNMLIPQRYHHKHDDHVSGFMNKSDKRQMGQGMNLYGKRKDGSNFPVEVGLSPLVVEGEHYAMALVIDITERKKVEDQLEHWAKIFNESLNEIYIFDAQSLAFIDVNRGGIKNLQYSLEELLAKTPIGIKPDFTTESFEVLIAPLRERQQEKIQFETRHRRKDGTTYPVEVHLQLSSLGNRTVFVAIVLDITERKNYTQKLEKTVQERTRQLTEALAKEKELNELKTKFLSLVSHEFKTPLSGILTSSALIGKYTREEQQVNREKHLNTIKNKVKYLTNIINDFLSVERLESGKVNYKYTRFPLSKVVNQVIYDANMLLKNGQKINYPKDIDEITLEFDEKILELILTNLVNNAIKYSPENSVIDITVVEKDSLLSITITDEGIGIPEVEQKFVFDRYFRAENALTNQGTGIGLNIVKSHLENLGGTITFTSTEGKGSSFLVSLPTLTNTNQV